MKIENLNSEFWKGMEEEYPEGIKIFNVWFEAYKIENDWIKLFGEDISTRIAPSIPHWSDRLLPEFHELPIAFQVGIFDEFMCEQEGEIESAKYKIEQRIMDCLGGFSE